MLTQTANVKQPTTLCIQKVSVCLDGCKTQQMNLLAFIPAGGKTYVGQRGSFPQRFVHPHCLLAGRAEESHCTATVGPPLDLRESDLPRHSALGFRRHLLQPHAEGDALFEMGQRQLLQCQVGGALESPLEVRFSSSSGKSLLKVS